MLLQKALSLWPERVVLPAAAHKYLDMCNIKAPRSFGTVQVLAYGGMCFGGPCTNAFYSGSVCLLEINLDRVISTSISCVQ